MDSPLVSVIIPVYGVEKYIERCARSIFEQTYDNLEIIFINDCTPDSSIEILQSVINCYPNLKSKTHIINHSHNKGLAGTRLTGLNAATGKYIQHIDSDDYIAHDMIERLVEVAERENADITVCDFCTIDSEGKSIHKPINPPTDNMGWVEKILTGEIHSSVCSKLTNKNLYFDYGIFPTEGLNQQEDLSVMYKLMYFAKKISYIPKSLYFYSQENINAYTRTQMSAEKQANNIMLLRQMDEFRKQNAPMEQKLTQAFIYQKAMIYSTISLLGNRKDLSQNDDIFDEVKLKDIFTHPTMNRAQKTAGVLNLLHLIALYPIIAYSHKLLKKSSI